MFYQVSIQVGLFCYSVSDLKCLHYFKFCTSEWSFVVAGMLPLKDLADSIAEKLQEQLFVGAQLYGKKNDRVRPCKVLKVMQEDAENVRYVVAWLDENNNIIEREEVSSQDLVQKKPCFSRNILKSFIRKSTYRNAPWVLHDKLAKKHGISTDIPEELRRKFFFNNGLVVCTKKRKNEVK